MFSVEILKKHAANRARITKITTPHGELVTPVFMPVATRAFVNYMTSYDLLNAGSQIILGGNTYHMLCAPGTDVIQASGGMHHFMNWHGPMLTDSGGFQIFSLSKNSTICKIDDDGASFRIPGSGAVVRMTPSSAIETQRIIGADIIMAFDQCTPDEDDRIAVIKAMERTHRWLIECKNYHDQFPESHYGCPQALFGIIQGGSFLDLRKQSAERVIDMDLDGIALGGETIGFNMEKTGEILDYIIPQLPENKPRYTMGVGLHPQNLIDAVFHGADMFDCVAPTRNARHGTLYAGKIVKSGDWLRYEHSEDTDKILIKKKIYQSDQRPIAQDCNCQTCLQYTRAYLHYLFKSKSVFYSQLACIHNIHVMHQVCEAIKDCVQGSN